MPVPLYILASGKDSTHREDLEKQLAIHRGLISYWSATQFLPGEAIAPQIEQRLRASRIAVWLISPDFRFEEEQGPEARLALELERAGVLRIIPVLIRITTHYKAPYVGRPVFPDNKVPVSSWNDRDAAWRNVVAGIRSAAQEIAGVDQGYTALGAPSLASRPLPVQPPPPVSPRSVAFLPPSVRTTPTPVPPPAVHVPVAPPAKPTAKSSGWRRVSVFLALLLIGLAGFVYVQGEASEATSSTPPSPTPQPPQPTPRIILSTPPSSTPSTPLPVSPAPAPSTPPSTTAVCCGGLSCPKEQERTLGTSCEKNDFCRPCKSGRDLVSGACADHLPLMSPYRLRLAGATIPGYKPGKTDTICVELAGRPPMCAIVEEAMKRPLLGLARISDLSTGTGVTVWFNRAGKTMWKAIGMLPDPAKPHLMNSALCVGAVLYSKSRSDIVRFYLDDP